LADGEIFDEGKNHPIGKCIFVFAGGTASSFKEFTERGHRDKKALRAFKKVKAPDFISRLKGTLDILGPNQRMKTIIVKKKEYSVPDRSDKNYLLRRALLLKGQEAMHNLTIEEKIEEALLKVPYCNHTTVLCVLFFPILSYAFYR